METIKKDGLTTDVLNELSYIKSLKEIINIGEWTMMDNSDVMHTGTYSHVHSFNWDFKSLEDTGIGLTDYKLFEYDGKLYMPENFFLIKFIIPRNSNCDITKLSNYLSSHMDGMKLTKVYSNTLAVGGIRLLFYFDPIESIN